MADGRRAAFGDVKSLGLSCKVVTIAGEAIAKNGNLSVNSDATREGATRFDLSDLEATKSRLEAIDRRLHELHALESSGGADLAGLQDEARRLETKATEVGARLTWCQEQLAAKREELRSVEAALAELTPEAARLARDESQLREEQRQLESRVSQAVKGRFARLSAAVGVEDVRAVERQLRREREAAQGVQDELSRRLNNVSAELMMYDQTLKELATRTAEELVPKLQAEVAELSEKERVLRESVVAAEAEVKTLEARTTECAEKEREAERSLLRFRQATKEKRLQLAALEKRLGEIAAGRQALCDKRTDLLRRSVLEDIEVPLLGGGLEALQDLAEAPSQATPTSSPSSIAVDFSELPAEKQAASSGPAARMLEEEYKSELSRLTAEVARLSPNLKAIDQMQGVAETVQTASHAADGARRDIEDAEAQFEAVRKARKECFMNCFTKVQAEIGQVYRRLTANTAGLGGDGGSAFLDLEDTEDPFNGGVKYTAMPPAKRFRDMHLLSGGEKTLAAMALLFAVHAYQKPPFMVLDEVDAALDANNVSALANYVGQADCQTIVISLKDKFFSGSEALVGVWKNKPEETSAVLTLDLTRYLTGADR
eukprot:gnl/TRDRNA2_/TRDRNA2_145422_c3_seq1.p1 gnl/TRDRNA2_/TRDRNA2_145422_c3~~gnl/TRDRNA2_/TRDRNA2_145422_c3_seq1.p1  ORF type:complete len:616 (+),score=174.23 gnl/TRDRNA2_/TRDRNA2_145422_c3_seq1:44-1849(+)